VSGALTHMGAPAIASLGALLDQPDTRPAAVRSLAKICHPDIVTPLLTVMDDPTPQIRAIAREAIGNFPDRRSLPLLLQALNDPASIVRREAVRGLGQKAKAIAKSPLEISGKPFGQPQLESILVKCLRDFSIEVCQQGAIALGRLATPTALDALDQTLQRETTPVPLRKTIVQTLGWSDRPKALEALAIYLNRAIQPSDQPLASPDQDRPDINQDTLATIQSIVQMLGRVTGAESKSKARHILHTWWAQATQSQIKPGEKRSPSPETSPKSGPTLAVPIREAIAQSLGQLGDLDSRDILNTLVQDPVPSVRYRAEAALRALS
ncbi:MAG: HEAT repeat domain-containing protein, partial [Cyanobacteria bacterium P01_H01_bin.130]